jgi:hypothetical protein
LFTERKKKRGKKKWRRKGGRERQARVSGASRRG